MDGQTISFINPLVNIIVFLDIDLVFLKSYFVLMERNSIIGFMAGTPI